MSKKKLVGITVACAIAMTAIIVMFTRTPMYTLRVSISPSGAGSVSPSSGEYEAGTEITLEARPASGYTFDRWSGDASGYASTITIEMDSDKDITAYFEELLIPEVEYKITGTASRVFVTFTNATGGTEQYNNVSVPHTYRFDTFTDWFLYISAQNLGEYGSVTVTIYLNGEVVATSTSSGAYVIATASYSRL